jgi:hypothetical protein
MTLYRQLMKSRVSDPLHTSRHYITRDVVDKLLTKDSIEIQLGRKSRSCIIFRSYLADKVVARNAKNLLAVLILCGKAGDIEDLLKHGFTDEDLPLISDEDSSDSTDEDPDAMEHDFELRSAGDPKKRWQLPEGWEDRDVYLFLQMQWMFLAPVFDVSEGHRHILGDCPLPFSDLEDIMSHNTVVVYKAKVNSFHHRGFEVCKSIYPQL